jgi:predicted phosphatase
MEKTIRRQKLPDTDSVEELAAFWDHHDLTDFEHALEEAREPVFVRAKGASVSIELGPAETQQLKKIARSKGVKETTVLRQWILERLHESFPL